MASPPKVTAVQMMRAEQRVFAAEAQLRIAEVGASSLRADQIIASAVALPAASTSKLKALLLSANSAVAKAKQRLAAERSKLNALKVRVQSQSALPARKKTLK